MENSITKSDWLFPHQPIPNPKFQPITLWLNRPTYHKSAKVSPPPELCPKLARTLPEVSPNLARTLPEVSPKLPKVSPNFAQTCPNFARSQPELCPNLPELCPNLNGKFHKKSDWLFPHHPIPNPKFQPITL